MFDGLPKDTTYAELLEFLKRDLQLDASVDVLPKTVTPVNLAPQVFGVVGLANQSIVTSSFSDYSGAWTIFTQGTYLKATAAGLTCTRAGVYLAIGRTRWDGGTTGLRAIYISKVGAGQYSNSEAVMQAFSSEPGMMTSQIVTLAAGDIISLVGLQTQGTNVTIASASVQAYLLGNSS